MKKTNEIKELNKPRFFLMGIFILSILMTQSGFSTSADLTIYEILWFFAILSLSIKLLIDLGLFLAHQRFDNILKQSDWKRHLYIFIEIMYSTWALWVILAILRSFIIDYYHIPSQSMLPNYKVGDRVVVGKTFIKASENIVSGKSNFNHGEVVVFDLNLKRHLTDDGNPAPIDEQKSLFKALYIKRIIAKEGDKIQVDNNGVVVIDEKGNQIINTQYFNNPNAQKYTSDVPIKENGHNPDLIHSLVENTYNIIYEPNELKNATNQMTNQVKTEIALRIFPTFLFNHKDSCVDFKLNSGQLNCTVPKDHYFVMGDNRTNSLDSRYWGFVHKDDIVNHVMFKF